MSCMGKATVELTLPEGEVMGELLWGWRTHLVPVLTPLTPRYWNVACALTPVAAMTRAVRTEKANIFVEWVSVVSVSSRWSTLFRGLYSA
jgi:hypothetical protein